MDEISVVEPPDGYPKGGDAGGRISHGQSSSRGNIDGRSRAREAGEGQGSRVMAGILTIGQSDGGGPAGRTPIIPLGHSRARFPRILPQGLYIRVIYKPGQLVVTSGGYTRPWSCCAKVPAVTPGLCYKLGKYCWHCSCLR